MELELLDLLGSQVGGVTTEEFREIRHMANVGYLGGFSVVTALEFFQHLFPEFGHGNLLSVIHPTPKNPR